MAGNTSYTRPIIAERLSDLRSDDLVALNQQEEATLDRREMTIRDR